MRIQEKHTTIFVQLCRLGSDDFGFRASWTACKGFWPEEGFDETAFIFRHSVQGELLRHQLVERSAGEFGYDLWHQAECVEPYPAMPPPPPPPLRRRKQDLPACTNGR